MPDPLAIRAALDAADPDDLTSRLVLADALDSDGHADPRGDVLRRTCAIRERVAGLALPDRFEAFWTESEGWRGVGRRLEALAEHPEDSDAFRRRCQRLLRGDVPLDPEDLEPTLRLQYDLQLRQLSSLNLVERDDEGQPFITAVDGKSYPLPPFEAILARLDTPALRQKVSQGFDTLLLVPFGLPLGRFLNAWRAGLRRNEPVLSGTGRFNAAAPLVFRDYFVTESLVYDPRSYTAGHGARTKKEVLRDDARGWDVLLVEGSVCNLPEVGQGHAVGGRRQIECGRAPEEYLQRLPDGETGMTPEAYVVQFLDALERKGQVIDARTLSFLTGAYLPWSRSVPSACWSPQLGRAFLDADDSGYRVRGTGMRAAVRAG